MNQHEFDYDGQTFETKAASNGDMNRPEFVGGINS